LSTSRFGVECGLMVTKPEPVSGSAKRGVELWSGCCPGVDRADCALVSLFCVCKLDIEAESLN
jgi:hypothetical protein